MVVMMVVVNEQLMVMVENRSGVIGGGHVIQI